MGESEMKLDWEILDNCKTCSETKCKNEIHHDSILEQIHDKDETLKSAILDFKKASSLMVDYTKRIVQRNELDRTETQIAELRREKARAVELASQVEYGIVKLKDVENKPVIDAVAKKAEEPWRRCLSCDSIHRERGRIVEMCNELQSQIVKLNIVLNKLTRC